MTMETEKVVGEVTDATMEDAENATKQPFERQELVVPGSIHRTGAVVVGVGAVGRRVAMALAQMGVGRLLLIDHDKVEIPNVATQGYWSLSVGSKKAEVTLADCLMCSTRDGPESWSAASERFTSSLLRDFGGSKRTCMFCCVDSMTARTQIQSAAENEELGLFVDTRLAAETGQVLSCMGLKEESWEQYRGTLFKDVDAWSGPSDRCTTRMTAYAAAVVAGLAVSVMVKWLRVRELTGDTSVEQARALIPDVIGVDLMGYDTRPVSYAEWSGAVKEAENGG